MLFTSITTSSTRNISVINFLDSSIPNAFTTMFLSIWLLSINLLLRADWVAFFFFNLYCIMHYTFRPNRPFKFLSWYYNLSLKRQLLLPRLLLTRMLHRAVSMNVLGLHPITDIKIKISLFYLVYLVLQFCWLNISLVPMCNNGKTRKWTHKELPHTGTRNNYRNKESHMNLFLIFNSGTWNGTTRVQSHDSGFSMW
jgi:hypothetical protein